MLVGERLKAALEAYASTTDPGAVVTHGSVRRSFIVTYSAAPYVDVLATMPVDLGKAVRPRWLSSVVNLSLAASGVGRRGLLELLTEGLTSSEALEADIDGPVEVARWNRLVARLAQTVSLAPVPPVRISALPDGATKVRPLHACGGRCRPSPRTLVERQRNASDSLRVSRTEGLAQRTRRIVTHVELLLRVSQQLLLTGRRGDPAMQSTNALLKREHRSADLGLLTRPPGEVVTASGRVPRGPDSLRVTSVPVIHGELVRAA